MADIKDKILKIPLRVLIVEDNALDRKIISSMLNEYPAHISAVNICENLSSALNKSSNEECDVCILDLNLPDSQGLVTLTDFNKRFPRMAIVVNTGVYEDDVGLQTISLGAQDFLVKGKYNAYVLNKVLYYCLERKRLEVELKEACEKLKETQSNLIQLEKMKVIGSLASGIAHEVKNPLATILYGITYLAENLTHPDENTASVLTNIKEAINRANDIINDLLNFSAIQNLEKTNINLNVVVEKALNLLTFEIAKNKIFLTKELINIPNIFIDHNRVEQVIINLILNSIRAMKHGGRLNLKTYTQILDSERRALLNLDEQRFNLGETVVILEVNDNGCGIKDADLNKIFDPFYTTRRADGGIGLGLTISRSIMEMHNGGILIENIVEGGARATLIFKI